MKPDKEQEIASNYIKGHSLIVAGAGTGKTTTLLYKVDYLIKNGFKENEILVISFTNETVDNFKNKCPYNIDIMTFHKLANKIIKSNKEIVDQEILEDCIKKYFNDISYKLRKKLFHMFYLSIYTDKKYIKDISKFDSDSITSFCFRTINQIRANNIDINDIDINIFTKNEKIVIYCIKNIIDYYNKTLKENNFIDFDSLIVEATKYINKNKYISPYKHILVDEYQDISKIRLELLQALINSNNALLTAVGDDFQSIYGFNGSNINLFYNFENHFKKSKTFYIRTTYRCPQKVINKAGKFIMKNSFQVKKELISNNKTKGKIIKILSKDYNKTLAKLIKKYQKSNYSVLVLCRNNFDANFYINKNNKIENTYFVYKNKLCKNIRCLTIHKAKGLEADIVIILNLSLSPHGFPKKHVNTIIDKIIKNEENFKNAEERRLFYVALTRCKKKVYLIIDFLSPSPFALEI